MLSRNQIKYIHSLKQKKFRDIHRQFIVEGSKSVLELLSSGYKISIICAQEEWISRHSSLLAKSVTTVTEIAPVTFEEMGRITTLTSPGPALAIAWMPEVSQQGLAPGEDLILGLDGISDPGNLGTIIRIADWFGIKIILCSENTAELYNPKVIQSSMGSFTRIQLRYIDLPSYLSTQDNEVKIFGTFPEGNNIYQHDLTPGGILLIGSESFGLSHGVEQYVTDRISIPPFGQAHAESLNASIATAIVCSEFRRRSLGNDLNSGPPANHEKY